MKKIHFFVRLIIWILTIISFLFIFYFLHFIDESLKSYLWLFTAIIVFLIFVYLLFSGKKDKQKDFWKNHPEQLEGEVFFSNVDSNHFDTIEYRTKRAGKIAYECNGKKFGKYPETFPVFIQRLELESSPGGRILLERIENKL